MSKKDDFIKIPMKPKKLEETITSAIERIQVIDVFDPESETLVQTTTEALKKSFYKPIEKPAVNVVYKVVYPDDLNLKPIAGSQKAKSRAGRPKKPKVTPQEPVESPPPSQKSKIQAITKMRAGREEPPEPVASQKGKIQMVSKTRSGREVKLPKYFHSDFKKIEIDDDHSPADPNDCDIKITDFVKYTENCKKRDESKVLNTKPLELDSLQKKRRIAAQYRCPKCNKAYLGRNKILEHLKKNPSHGPMHQNEENHFEVWNYLVSITQKCPSSERGPKFCQELSNLLHNLLLLTNALFKKLGSAANEVKIDKVLGNAIGLDPGTYYFDDNNLYKDVTVLQLMGNTDFLNSIRSKTDDNIKASEKNCQCGKLSTIDELVLKSMLISSEANDSIAKKIGSIKINQQKPLEGDKCEINKDPAGDDGNNEQFAGDDFFASSRDNLTNYSSLNDYEMKSDMEHRLSPSIVEDQGESKSLVQSQAVNFKSNNEYFSPYVPNSFSEGVLNQFNDKPRPKSPKIKIQSNILICPPNPKFLQANKNPINPELLTDNSVLMPMPNLQHSVDELMLPVPSEPGSILDNSSSSDEVMNVDQFVNERFRRITETDLEVTNSNSLNLDLPALDLFQFHTT